MNSALAGWLQVALLVAALAVGATPAVLLQLEDAAGEPHEVAAQVEVRSCREADGRFLTGATITEIDGSHVIMISQPDAVTEVILAAVKAVSPIVAVPA